MDINLIEVLKKANLMQKKRIIEGSIAFFIITFFILSPVPSLAGEQGYMITKDNETIWDPNGNTSIPSQTQIWFTEERAKIALSKNFVLLIDMTKGNLYQLDTQNKTYRILKLPEEEMKWKTKTQKMNQEKRCAEWDCYGVKGTMQAKDISFDIECWLTKDIDIPIPLRKKVAKYLGSHQIMLTEELAQYEGYPVQTILTMKAHDKEIKMISNVIEAKRMDIDPKIFKIPDDFNAVDAKGEKTHKDEKSKDPNIKNPNIKEDESVNH